MKSGSLIMDATRLSCLTEFIDCDEEATMMVATSEVIFLWDLKLCHQTQMIPIRSGILAGLEQTMSPVDVKLTADAKPIVQFAHSSFQYSTEDRAWIEQTHQMPNRWTDSLESNNLGTLSLNLTFNN